MISLNSIEHPFFQLFCSFLCPRFKVPNPRVLREIIINYSKHLLNQNLSCIKSPYVSIMFDGTSRWSRHFISIILYTRYQFIYYKTKIVNSENTFNILNVLNECISNLRAHNKIICSICCDNYSANKSACEKLTYKIFRQYCNYHCASLALSNQFALEKPNYKITLRIQLALRLLKNYHPPYLSKIKWKSMAECLDFIVKNYSNLSQLIYDKLQKKIQRKKKEYEKLRKTKWIEIKNAVDVITTFISNMESDEIKIENVFGQVAQTYSKLSEQKTKIANDLLKELITLYFKNVNLIIPLSAFLLTDDGRSFWQKSPRLIQTFLLPAGWAGIRYFCFFSNISVDENMHNCFINHLTNNKPIEKDPYLYWMNLQNTLSDVACRILSIPCSEASVERLFGGLTFMIDPTSNRMKDELVDAEMNIRMSSVFDFRNEFKGNFKEQIEKSNEFLINAFPEIIESL